MANGKDEDLRAIFIEEASDLLLSLSSTLRTFEQDIHQHDNINDLKRDLHTLKGSARMVGVVEVGILAHEIETLCEAIYKKEIPINRDIFNVIGLGIDKVSLMIDALKNEEKLSDATDILEKIKKYTTSADIIKSDKDKDKSTDKDKEKRALEEKESLEIKGSPQKAGHDIKRSKEKEESFKSAAETQPEVQKEESKGALHQEMIRVRAPLLEKLTSLSAENSMLRVNLEQHISILGNYLLGMKQETKRLEAQLNSLSTDIQSQIMNKDISVQKQIVNAFNGKTTSVSDQYTSIEETNQVLKETTFDIINMLKSLTDTHLVMENLILTQGRVSTELQHRLSDTRLVPFESIVPRLSRIARSVGQELNKEIDFRVMRSEGEMDRTVLERLIPSLEHILRNAIDHGIEPSNERLKKGKPAIGKIEVSFFRKGSTASIEVKDDGAGIDSNIVRKKAIKLGLLDAKNTVSDEEVLRYILVPGFSTRESVTQISGRGVGMDVVNTAVTELGGNLLIDSEPNQGTTITVRFPFTASLNRTLIFNVQDKILGMFLTSIESVIQVDKERLMTEFAQENPTLKEKEKTYHLEYLGALLEGREESIHIPSKKTFPVILFSGSEYPVAFVIDSILFSREFVIQSLGGQFKLTNECSGATFLGDGRAVLILDPFNLSLKAKSIMERGKINIEFDKEKGIDTSAKALIMIVDDSVSVRAVTQRLLERNQYQVITAKDGLDALQQLETATPNIILLDLDMPRMDGFELAATLRRDEKFKDIPIIVISSRASSIQDKQQTELKLNGFIKKPYQENELLSAIQELIGEAK